MGRRFAILEKKLSELESQLRQLSSASLLCLPRDCDELAGKLRFLMALLSSEMEINAQDREEHLRHITDRFAIVEKAFLDWIDVEASPEQLLDAMPTCSCADACLLEEEEEEHEEAYDFTGIDDPAADEVVGDTGSQEISGVSEEEGLKEEDKEDVGSEKEGRNLPGHVSNNNKKKCRIVAAVVGLAAAIVGVALSIGGVEEEFFVPPT